MSDFDRCPAINITSLDCVLWCNKAKGHDGRHSAAFGPFIDRGVTVHRDRDWSDDSPRHSLLTEREAHSLELIHNRGGR